MRLHDLKPAPGSRPKATRKGRGLGTGLGKTAGRGHKGQKARSGGGVRRGFEGGQMPLTRRLPKRGFNNEIFARHLDIINLSDLERFDEGAAINLDSLKEAGLLKNSSAGYKLLGDGEVKKRFSITAQAASQAAIGKIEAAGGKVEVV